jgi:hypothetical protein
MNIGITDILNRCKSLQSKGLNVSFDSSRGSIKIEHRNKISYELIAGFEIRDTENQNMIDSVINYLITLESEVNAQL